MSIKKTPYAAIILAVLFACILSVPALADAGNFSGHSDFGGSSGGSFSGSFGDSGLWGLAFLGSGGGGGSFLFLIIILYIIFSIYRNRKTVAAGNTYSAFYSDLMPIDSIRTYDPNFSEEAIKEKIANLYVQMQDAWQNKNFETMRPYMTDTLYSQFKRQLDELIRSGCTNYIERIAVLDVTLSGWKSDDVNDVLIAVINTRIVDYTVSNKTGKVVSGSKTAEKFMTYEWTLIRSKGMKTPEPAGEGGKETSSLHCPSCGAPVDINQSAKCPYCDSIIFSDLYTWTISSIKGISQQTQY